MLIILEGPDLAGKSTLAAELQAFIAVRFPEDHVTLLHRGPPTSHPLHEYVTPLLDYWPTGREHIICDRWHYGELIYPMVTGRKTAMNDGVFRYVEAFLAAKGALLVHVDADAQDIMDRYRFRGDATQSLDTVLRVAQTYRDHMPRTILPRSKSFDVQEIVESAMMRELIANDSKFSWLKTYVGVPNPLTLFVGDVRGCAGGLKCDHKVQHDARFPAFGPFLNTCGEFLMRALPRDIFEWGIVNANDVDNNVGYEPHIDVVALGREASRTLTAYRVNHTVVPHPQFVKRFHSRELLEYRRLLGLRDGKEHGTWRS